MKRILFPLLILMALQIIGFSGVHADEMALSQTVQASQTAVYQVELHNETAAAHDYALSLSGLPGTLTTTFTQGGPLLSQVTVPMNEYGLVTMRVDVPAETAVGHYTAQFTATRDDGSSLILPVTLNVENIYAVTIISQNLNLSAFSGQSFTFETVASNSGAAAVTNLALSVKAPAKWVVQSAPLSVPTLDPGAEVVFQVSVLVPASQVASDQSIKLALTSEQTTSPDSTLLVRVQNSPTFLYVAAAVIALAIIAVFLYFRRQGRR